jgi:hypothetical protein
MLSHFWPPQIFPTSQIILKFLVVKYANPVPRRIFVRKRSEVREGWTKLHNEELHDLYCSPNMIRMVHSKRMRSTGHVARIRGRECKVL